MKMTKRERNLLTLLLAVMIIGGYLYYFDDYYAEDEIALNAEIQMKEAKIRAALIAGADAKNFDNQHEILSTEVLNKIDKLLVNVNQEDIILLMTEIMADARFSVSSESFINNTTVLAGALENNIYAIGLSYDGSYDDLMVILNKLWDYDKWVAVNDMSITIADSEDESTGSQEYVRGDEVAAEFTISMYNLHLDYRESDELIQWVLGTINTDRNPFELNDNPNITSDYFYTGEAIEYEDIAVSSAFTDITNHWARNEIIFFSQSKYVYGFDNQLFEPDTPVTKSQFTVMLDRILQWPLATDLADLTSFEDFENLDGFEYEYKKALYKGYLSGGIIETLGPNEILTRRQVQNIVRQTINPDFSWPAYHEVLEINGVNIDDDPSNLDQIVTRAEAVYLLYYFK
jgi:hypothetical protein